MVVWKKMDKHTLKLPEQDNFDVACEQLFRVVIIYLYFM